MILTTKQQLLLGLLVIIGILAIVFYFPGPKTWLEKKLNKKPDSAITTFEECAKYYPVLESYPERCSTKSGASFTRDIGNELEKADLIKSTTPRPGDTIMNPLVIEGEARGYWFFEATAPVELYNNSGVQIASGYIEAQGEWMTEDFVPYTGTLDFPPAASGSGYLLIKKANASGLPEHDDSLSIPVVF
jgi:hypothetical protein